MKYDTLNEREVIELPALGKEAFGDILVFGGPE